MSRIIVKQLPKNITEDKLRAVFGQKGTITDMQLKYTADGRFRQFCFVGYRSEEEAQEAIAFYNNTCIQTNRIKVELCASLGAEDKPQAWSKHAKDSKSALKATDIVPAANDSGKDSAKKKKDKGKDANARVADIIGEHKDDPDFAEFLKAHDKKRSLWANDADAIALTAADVDDDHEEVVTKDSGVADEADSDNDSDADEPAEEIKVAAKPISDLEYMKSLMGGSTKTVESQEAKLSSKASKKKTNDKDFCDLFTIKMHDVPYKLKRQDILKFFKPLKPFSVRLPTKVHGFCYVGFKTQQEMTKAMVKNKSFIKGKQVFFSDFTEKNKVTKAKLAGKEVSAEGGATPAPANAKWLRQQQGQTEAEQICESGRIFFRNLAYTVTEEQLREAFEPFGPVAEVNLPVDTVTRQIKGFGTVTFMMPEHAVRAYNQLDGSDFHGRLLHLIPAKARAEDQPSDDVDNNLLSFKQKKALKLKQQAQQTSSWNTLFLGANAVADILAKRFETSKEQILDTNVGGGGSSAAVRIALGETQIVNEMKQFLEKQGVCLKAFEGPLTAAKRSNCVILAKNLPADTSVGDLTPLFAKFGPLARLVLPPSGVTALIEFCDPSEARHAFKRLAFSKFKNVPLFLEWAPENAFSNAASPESKTEVTAAIAAELDDSSAQPAAQEVEPEEDEEEEDQSAPPEPNTTLFVRNLNFLTTVETVHKHFKNLGAIHSVEIARRKDASNPRQSTSLGYGFVQFKRTATLELALKRLQLSTIDGNQVELKRSDRALKTDNDAAAVRRKVTKVGQQNGTKLMVRNIPFQAHASEVREIFKAFGELRSLRLPMKTTPGETNIHRGFGFVDFVTKSDAKHAFDALSSSTHLYGRRLVLEWASTDDADDVAELRKRTASQYQAAAHKETNNKRSRKAIFDVEANGVGGAGDGEEES